MLPMGWSAAEEKAFNTLLKSHHRVDIRVQLLDLSQNYLSDLSKRLVGGQVVVDATTDITRSLDIDILDPARELALDSESPVEGALFMDRMIRVVYGIISPDGTQQFYVPLFCGPIHALERNGSILSLECQGKEILGMDLTWKSYTFKKGMRIIRIIRSILTSVLGENAYRLPTDLTNRSSRDISLGLKTSAFKVAHHIAAGAGFQLFYDGRGVARMRRRSRNLVWTFRPKTKAVPGDVLTEPNFGFDITKVINAVQVIGAKPKNSSKPIKVRVVAPRSHPLSPWNLGRNGVPRFIPETIEDDSIRTQALALARAKTRLRRGLMEGTTASFNALPNPRLEPLDAVRIIGDGYEASFILRQFTIPLSVTDQASIGYVKKLTPNLRAIRGRRA